MCVLFICAIHVIERNEISIGTRSCAIIGPSSFQKNSSYLCARLHSYFMLAKGMLGSGILCWLCVVSIRLLIQRCAVCGNGGGKWC